MFFKIIGFGVAALVAVGIMNWGSGLFDGTSQPTPNDLQRNVNNQFADVGLSVPQGGGQRHSGSANPGSYPAPYISVPQGTDLPGQLQGQQQDGALFTPGR